MLSDKLSGSHMGLWLLVPEYLRLGGWDLVRGLFGKGSEDIPARLGMQMVSESALCVNRVRKKGSLCHQGFCLVNGLSFLATDESIHDILRDRPVSDYEVFQSALMRIRMADGHYDREEKVFSIDPHRIISTTRRTMPQKKKRPEKPSEKMMQTFFCNDASTGQPLGFTLSASGKKCSQATLQLMELVSGSGIKKALVLADKEHFTKEIAEYFSGQEDLAILMPAPNQSGILETVRKLDYRIMWAGYSVAETVFNFSGSRIKYRLIAQKECAAGKQDVYKAFITTSDRDATELLTKVFTRRRWSIEEFFNFEGDMGWNRASTFNLNIRYGKQTLALLAQAAAYRLRQNLPGEYKKWTAGMLSEKVFTNMEGDIRVGDDKIIVTYYKDHEILGLREKYSNISQQLENENICPKIPWLYNYELEFRFK